ncbi:hypothetical protein [Actinomyces sp. zg-332]|nr:hypothetical protein [Actinomyces sp. zg-332]
MASNGYYAGSCYTLLVCMTGIGDSMGDAVRSDAVDLWYGLVL